ncbi:MAG: hypothetical protein IKU51_01745 [Clostridia bacterium]|nr:hypothetical protein [Clostridia bacterium]
MKKFVSIVLTLCLLFLLTSCEGNNHTTGVITLPIEGYFASKGEILVETDPVLDAVVPFARAYVYENGEWYELERYETEITISKEFTYGEYSGRDITLPIQYFAYHSKIYAYPNVEKISEVNVYGLDMYSVPSKENCILIDQYGVFSTMYVDLSSGDITPIFREDMPLKGGVACVSDNAPYAAIICNMEESEPPTGYIVDLNNISIKEIVLPPYDESKYSFNDLYPLALVNSRLYVWYRLFVQNENDKEGTLVYDIEKGTVDEYAENLSLYDAFNSDAYSYIQMKCDQDTGTVRVLNLKSGEDYSFTLYPSIQIGGTPSSTGRYLLCTYYDTPLAGYDENGNSYYENSLKTVHHIVVDMKNQKQIDLSKVDPKLDLDAMTYNGVSCTGLWVSDTEIAIVTYSSADEGARCIQTVIDVEDAL